MFRFRDESEDDFNLSFDEQGPPGLHLHKHGHKSHNIFHKMKKGLTHAKKAAEDTVSNVAGGAVKLAGNMTSAALHTVGDVAAVVPGGSIVKK